MRYLVMGLVLILGVAGCSMPLITKKPPLVPSSQSRWEAINSQEFIPPKAATYVKVSEFEPAANQLTKQE